MKHIVKRRVRVWASVAMTLCVLVATTAKADYVVVTPPSDIRYQDILSAAKAGNLEYAYRLLEDAVYARLKSEIYDAKRLAVNVDKLLSLVDKIVNDPSATEEEKSAALIRALDNALIEAPSAPTGSLAIVMKHAPEYGVVRLEWDRMVEVDECKGGMYMTRDGVTWWEAWIDYVTKVPDYYIYRVVDGQEALLATLRGSQIISRESVTITKWADLWDLYKMLTTEFSVDQSKAFWFDYDADMRTGGTTLSYKVIADNSAYKYGRCGTSESYVSTAVFDGDGDGYADFVPKREYAVYFGKYYGWLVPVVSLMVK